MSESAQPGWHPDPLGQHQNRWWDGQRWTDHVHDPAPVSQPPPTAATNMVQQAPSPALTGGPPPPPPATGHQMTQPAPAGYSSAPTGMTDADARRWAQSSHLLCLTGYLLPIIYVAIPLAILFTKGKESEFVSAHAKEAFNFTVSILIYMVLSGLAIFIVIGWLLLFSLVVFDIVNILRASGAAGRGQSFRYPLCIRFLR